MAPQKVKVGACGDQMIKRVFPQVWMSMGPAGLWAQPVVMPPISNASLEALYLATGRVLVLSLLLWGQCSFGRKWKENASPGISHPYHDSKSRVINSHPRGISESTGAVSDLWGSVEMLLALSSLACGHCLGHRGVLERGSGPQKTLPAASST